MFVVTPRTVWNPAALETRNLPKRLLGRVAFLPRNGDAALWARTLFETQVLRFTVSLAPFVVAMFVWPDLALPIAQAPLAMLLLIGVIEMKVLHVPREKRDAVTSEDAAARAMDALRFRSLAILTRLAAAEGVQAGELMLVVEQSELARVTPLTLVSVQSSDPQARVRGVSPELRAMIRDTLFDADFTERHLQAANQRAHDFVRTVTLEAGTVSAHARVAALRARAA